METIDKGPEGSRLDEVLPRWDVSKKYALAVDAAPDVVFSAIERYEPGSSVVVRVLMALRGYGSRKTGSAEGFSAFEEEGFAKAAWNLSVSAAGAGGTILETETRVLCFGTGARRAFGIYWNTIELASGAIRMSMLRGIRRLALSTGGDA
jgi:hypothetical protein